MLNVVLSEITFQTAVASHNHVDRPALPQTQVMLRSRMPRGPGQFILFSVQRQRIVSFLKHRQIVYRKVHLIEIDAGEIDPRVADRNFCNCRRCCYVYIYRDVCNAQV